MHVVKTLKHDDVTYDVGDQVRIILTNNTTILGEIKAYDSYSFPEKDITCDGIQISNSVHSGIPMYIPLYEIKHIEKTESEKTEMVRPKIDTEKAVTIMLLSQLPYRFIPSGMAVQIDRPSYVIAQSDIAELFNYIAEHQ